MIDDFQHSAERVITLRPALPEEAHLGAHATYSADPGLYRHVFARDETATLQVLEQLWPLPGHHLNHSWATVAELSGEVAGMMLACTGRDERRGVWKTVRAVSRFVGPWGLLRMVPGSLDLLSTAPAVASDAFYVITLAVFPWARRHGAGRRLLEAAEQLAQERGCGECALDVAVGNQPAEKLYVSEGYSIVAAHRSDRLAGLAGIDGYRRMVKPLA